ncbi:hypothetical protein SAMN04489713_13439 [Actinomadura madurae]|uniref:Uncharacterized protein n=1 Tax=Actinomadura madurae TaxID=1993 RepID=A0A1I5YLJ5_9ACTN|nr:hypothetical protein [Actinomadura madurae]SFQ45111.1 hypothetical protein SAMN04489713_13439 [Actinomadura madurae]
MNLDNIDVPEDVIEYVRDVFKLADRRATSKLDRMPTTHEEWLDFSLIDAISEASGPHETQSGVTVDIAVHFVGGGVHWKRWEVADLGFIVNFRRPSELIRTKVVLLQSKRLYPRESEFIEDAGVTMHGGFGSLMEPSSLLGKGPRNFTFDEACRYKALQIGDRQWQSIADYEENYKIPVHYLLYHPHAIPYSEVEIPVRLPVRFNESEPEVGSRVLRASVLHLLARTFPRNYAPSYAEVKGKVPALGVQLPDFVADEVLKCREGYVVDDGIENEGLRRVFSQRSAPIAAAIRVDIVLP